MGPEVEVAQFLIGHKKAPSGALAPPGASMSPAGYEKRATAIIVLPPGRKRCAQGAPRLIDPEHPAVGQVVLTDMVRPGIVEQVIHCPGQAQIGHERMGSGQVEYAVSR